MYLESILAFCNATRVSRSLQFQRTFIYTSNSLFIKVHGTVALRQVGNNLFTTLSDWLKKSLHNCEREEVYIFRNLCYRYEKKVWLWSRTTFRWRDICLGVSLLLVLSITSKFRHFCCNVVFPTYKRIWLAFIRLTSLKEGCGFGLVKK